MKKSYVTPLYDVMRFPAEDIMTISGDEKTGDLNELDFNGLNFQ